MLHECAKTITCEEEIALDTLSAFAEPFFPAIETHYNETDFKKPQKKQKKTKTMKTRKLKTKMSAELNIANSTKNNSSIQSKISRE